MPLGLIGVTNVVVSGCSLLAQCLVYKPGLADKQDMRREQRSTDRRSLGLVLKPKNAVCFLDSRG